VISSPSRFTPARLSGWEAALAEYIAAKRDEPFVWGRHDCCTFVSGAAIAMTGHDPMAEFRGRYTTRIGSLRALSSIGGGDLEHVLDAKFDAIPIGQARRGDFAFAPDAQGRGAVGIVAGPFAWFVSEAGLERIAMRQWHKAWSVGHG